MRILASCPENRAKITDTSGISLEFAGANTSAVLPGLSSFGRMVIGCLFLVLGLFVKPLFAAVRNISGGLLEQVQKTVFRSNSETVRKLDGICVILDVMRAHTMDIGVQEPGCAALWNLAYNSDECKLKIADAGGINVILEAIGSHESHAGVEERGLGALGCIGWQDKALQQRINSAGAQEILKNVLSKTAATTTVKQRVQILLNKLKTHPSPPLPPP